ncbi:hypothetical protein E2C01_083623 [Portunus trituberculatus]|uniref:Uncharacterized protein n=1 Tax=Portunus trituberculatus TaxID=210409 RepID=A0A5B7J8I1_PORTR|nr:hypothetical protein [Portunus trituberculatus]
MRALGWLPQQGRKPIQLVGGCQSRKLFLCLVRQQAGMGGPRRTPATSPRPTHTTSYAVLYT